MTPEIDETLTIAPPPAAMRCGSAARQWTNTLRTLVVMSPSHSSSVVSTIGLSRKRPALLTTTSRRPKRLRARSTARRAVCGVGGVAQQGRHPVVARARSTAGIDVLGDHLRAGLAQLAHDGRADAPGGTGDDRDAALEARLSMAGDDIE